jgi:hypothetical protein
MLVMTLPNHVGDDAVESVLTMVLPNYTMRVLSLIVRVPPALIGVLSSIIEVSMLIVRVPPPTAKVPLSADRVSSSIVEVSPPTGRVPPSVVRVPPMTVEKVLVMRGVDRGCH